MRSSIFPSQTRSYACISRVPTATGKPGKPGKTAEYPPGREKTGNSVIMGENREKTGKNIFPDFFFFFFNRVKISWIQIQDNVVLFFHYKFVKNVPKYNNSFNVCTSVLFFSEKMICVFSTVPQNSPFFGPRCPQRSNTGRLKIYLLLCIGLISEVGD